MASQVAHKRGLRTFGADPTLAAPQEGITISICELLRPLDTSPVVCDGFVRMATKVLQSHNIPHEIMVGQVNFRPKRIPHHFWIACDEGKGIIDFRARMWLGSDAPHGLISPIEARAYQARPVRLEVLVPSVFKILSGFDFQVLRQPLDKAPDY